MTIKEVEERTGIPCANIRYYEREKLLHPTRKAKNQYREYTEEDIFLLHKIRFFRTLGFSIKEIKAMQEASNLTPFLENQLKVLEEKQEEYKQLCFLCAAMDSSQAFQDICLPCSESYKEHIQSRREQIQQEDVPGRYIILIFTIILIFGIIVTAGLLIFWNYAGLI